MKNNKSDEYIQTQGNINDQEQQNEQKTIWNIFKERNIFLKIIIWIITLFFILSVKYINIQNIYVDTTLEASIAIVGDSADVLQKSINNFKTKDKKQLEKIFEKIVCAIQSFFSLFCAFWKRILKLASNLKNKIINKISIIKSNVKYKSSVAYYSFVKLKSIILSHVFVFVLNISDNIHKQINNIIFISIKIKDIGISKIKKYSQIFIFDYINKFIEKLDYYKNTIKQYIYCFCVCYNVLKIIIIIINEYLKNPNKIITIKEIAVMKIFVKNKGP